MIWNDIPNEGALFINNLREEKLGHLLQPSKTMTVLDVGTGTGSGLMFFCNNVNKMVGLDGTKEMLDEAQKKLSAKNIRNVELIHANALDIPWPDKTFDAVISLNFIHLFTPAREQKPFITEMMRVTKDDGAVIVEFSNAFLGLGLGVYRKFFVKDIGYNWLWDIYRMNANMKVSKVVGLNLPGTKKMFKIHKKLATIYSNIASIFPFKFLANRLLVKFEKR